MYDDEKDAKKKLRWLLKHPEEAKKIGRQGRREVLLNHTYDARARTILQGLGWP
jgi:spore maturation protein CgeB